MILTDLKLSGFSHAQMLFSHAFFFFLLEVFLLSFNSWYVLSTSKWRSTMLQ